MDKALINKIIEAAKYFDSPYAFEIWVLRTICGLDSKELLENYFSRNTFGKHIVSVVDFEDYWKHSENLTNL